MAFFNSLLGAVMDYFQGVVTECLRANRATFVNTECLIQLHPGDSPAKGEHWYCDAVAVNFQEKVAYLCEVTYSRTLQSLLSRLSGWINNWAGIELALARDCGIGADWAIQPLIFIPGDREPLLKAKFAALLLNRGEVAMPPLKIKHLEDVVPWKYRSWDRKLEVLAEESHIQSN